VSPSLLVERTLARVHATLNSFHAATLIVLLLLGIPARGLIDATWEEAGGAWMQQLDEAEGQRGVLLAELARERARELASERAWRDETRCPGPDQAPWLMR